MNWPARIRSTQARMEHDLRVVVGASNNALQALQNTEYPDIDEIRKLISRIEAELITLKAYDQIYRAEEEEARK